MCHDKFISVICHTCIFVISVILIAAKFVSVMVFPIRFIHRILLRPVMLVSVRFRPVTGVLIK